PCTHHADAELAHLAGFGRGDDTEGPGRGGQLVLARGVEFARGEDEAVDGGAAPADGGDAEIPGVAAHGRKRRRKPVYARFLDRSDVAAAYRLFGQVVGEAGGAGYGHRVEADDVARR